MARPLIERRRSPRYLCSQVVEVAHHAIRRTGLLEDVSLNGAGVALDAAIEPGQMVELLGCPPGRGAGVRALIRNCRRRETDFLLGLEFSGYQWRPADWQPGHLFPPHL